FPERIRKSSAIRLQICCWSALMFALSLLLMPAHRAAMEGYLGYFASAFLMIALYSGGAVYRLLRKDSKGISG
ncbi:MAG TPA: hypothetical protein VMT64_05340, partial [Candidatus Binataceae bacterium]|nr:hypothetical protein [Candidatus Binataceae bacterium]